MSAWQRIETIEADQKDGRAVLLWSDAGPVVARWLGVISQWMIHYPCYPDCPEIEGVTHWQPAPRGPDGGS